MTGHALRTRRYTAFARVLPDFLIIGAARSGTTSLYEYLCAHPDVRPAFRKQAFFFDVGWFHGLGAYRAWFPLCWQMDGGITGEATPSYLFHPIVAERVHSVLPDVKIIVLLRDPVTRLVSHYRYNVDEDGEPRSLREIIASERLDFGALVPALRRGDADAVEEARYRSLTARGFYAQQLERWFSFFSRDQILVLRAERMFSEPRAIFGEVLDFLGLSEFTGLEFETHNAASPPLDDPELMTEIAAIYESSNRDLVRLLGPEWTWPPASSHQP